MIGKFYCGLKVFGAENVPKEGPFILVSNHESNADPFILGASLPCSKWFSYLAKKEIFEGRIRGWYFRKIHAIPLNRGEADPSAIKKALGILKSGRPMVLFPEGTRSRGKGLQAAKPGIGFIVAKAKVPVVPAYIEGSYKALPESLGSIKRSRVNVYIGKSVYFDWNGFDKHGKGAYQHVSDEIMRRIAELKDVYVNKVG